MREKQSPSFVDYFTVITKRRHFLIRVILITTGAALIISLLIAPQYTATATILPPNPQQETMLGLLSGNILGGLGGISGLGSMLPGATTPSDLFAAILRSERIADNIIQKYNLKKVFKTKTIDDTYKNLKSITKIDVTPEGIVSVSVTWYDKYLAADIANSYIEELDEFNTETAMTTGKKYRIFIEERLRENTDSLAMAEDELRKFQEKHRTVALDIELQSVIEAIAELKSQTILLEVQKAAIASPNDYNNPHVKNINRQLRALRKQLSRIEFGDSTQSEKEFGAGFAVPFSELPEVSLKFARLLRDVKVQSAIFELLTQQYERAKIMELKDMPTVQVLDSATPPERKSSPKRARIVILAAFSSLIFGLIGTFLLESFEHLKKQPDEFEKWLIIAKKIKDDLRNTRNWIAKRFKK